MQVPTSVAIKQVLRFYCNYVGGNFCYNYVGGSSCCNYAGDCFCCSYAVRRFCTIYAGENLCSNMWMTIFIEIMHMGVCCNHTGGVFYSALCK